MAVLVTGATGRVGSRLVPKLLQHGESVRVLARDPDRSLPLRDMGAEVVEGDVRDESRLGLALKDVDAVIHLAAAFRRVRDEEAVAINEDATRALGRAAVAENIGRFIFASTNLVYSPGRGRPAREDDELLPDGSYGIYPQTKVAAERALRELDRESGLGLRVLRLAFVYGEGDPHLAESLLWAREWPLHKRLHLVHHTDVGQALLRALSADGIDGETFNVADDAPVTAFELLEVNAEPVAAEAADRPLQDPWEGIVDCAKARRELGFRPIFPSLQTARAAGAL